MSRSIWARLGVRAGSSRDEIRRAYARKLKTCHPEDDPEGFQALREAYESALRYVDYEQEEEFGFDEPGETPPAPATAPGPAEPREPEPEDGGERRQLELALERFTELLNWPEPVLVESLTAALEDVLAAPALQEIALRERTEHRIAWQLANAIPRSDCLIERAIEAFGWGESTGWGRQDSAVEAILARIEEWRFIGRASRVDDPLNLGWRALAGPPAPKWQMRLGALSSAQTEQARMLLDLAGYQMPGLRHHFEPGRVEWWRQHLSRARITIDTLLLAPLVLYLLWTATQLTAPTAASKALPAILPFALAAPFLYLRFVKQRHFELQNGMRAPFPPWAEQGWMAGIVAIPAASLLFPPNALGKAGTALLAAAFALWTILVQPPSPPLAPIVPRAIAVLRRLWFSGFLAVAALGAIPVGRMSQWASAGLALVILWWRGREEMVRLVVRYVPRWPQAAAAAAAAALAGLAWAWTGARQGGENFYLVAHVTAVGCMILVAAWHAEAGPNRLVLLVGWVALGAIFVNTYPPPPPAPAAPAGSGVPLITTDPSTGQRVAPESCKTDMYSRECMDFYRDVVREIRETQPAANSGSGETERPVAPPPPPPPPPRIVRRTAVCPPAKARPGESSPPVPCSPGRWFIPTDYPVEAVSAKAAGSTTVRYKIDIDGRVRECEVRESSGSALLDRTTCRLLEAHARYRPARDSEGQPVATHGVFTLDWTLRD